jgi:hypothetical protein
MPPPSNRPGGTPAKPTSPAKKPTNDRDSSPETHLEILGMFKVSVSEASSWMTMLKILTLVLGSWLGIKLINAMFRRMDEAKISG